MRSNIARACLYVLGVVTMVCSMSGRALAGVPVPVVPELDGASFSAGLAAASAAVLILRSRRRSK